MKPRHAYTMFAAACVAASSVAHAAPLNDRASVVLFAGGDVATPGTIRGPVSLTSADGPTRYDRLDLDDTYHRNYTAGAEFDFAVDSHLAAFARASYSQFDGANRVLGDNVSETNGYRSINARFGDEDSKQLDVGARYTFSNSDRWRPFVGASLGAVRQSSMYADVDNLATSGVTRVELGKASTVFQQRVETGLQVSPSRNLDLRLTAAASHVNDGKRSDDPNLGLLAPTDAESGVHAHWEYPAELGAVWHF
jgi:hypothetical protein